MQFVAVVACGVLALEQAAVDEQGAVRGDLQAVAAAGNAGPAAVVGDVIQGGSSIFVMLIVGEPCNAQGDWAPTPPALRAGSLGRAGLLPFLNLPQWLSLATLWELGFARRMAP